MTKAKTTGPTPHPAPFTPEILARIDPWIPVGSWVLDPFAGIGGIHSLRPRLYTVGVELEPEWANQSPYTVVGNALDMFFFPPESFDAIATSPCYGNRFADHHNAKDASYRRSYKHLLGRDPSSYSSAIMQWGEDYRSFHALAWAESLRVLRRGGRFILNIKNHMRGGEEQKVSEWHAQVLRSLDLVQLKRIKVPATGFRNGENNELRVPYENIYVFLKVM